LRIRLWSRRRARARAAALALSLASAVECLRTAGSSGTATTALLPASVDRLAEFVALRGGDRVAEVEAIVNRGLREGELRGADFLQLAIDRGTIGLVGGEQVLQVDTLHLEVGAAANLCLAEIGFLLANLGELFIGDANLLANGRVAQSASETKSPSSLSAAKTAAAGATASTETIASPAPSAAAATAIAISAPTRPRWTARPEAVPRSLLLGRGILGVALRQDRSATERKSQHSKSSFRTKFHDVLPYRAFRGCYPEFR
jgi:hypothetical protein